MLERVMAPVRALFAGPTKPLYGDQYVSLVDEEYQRRRKERRPWELQWRLNLEFLDNRQYRDIDVVHLQLVDLPRLTHYEEREVFNQISPIYEIRCGKLSRMRPGFRVRPASTERQDVMAAKVSSKIVKGTYYETDAQVVLAQAIAWAEATGTVFLKSVWNPQKGRALGFDWETGEEVYEGDIEFTVVSPFEVYPDSPWLPELSMQRSIILARAFHVDDIEDIWGVKVEPEEIDSFTLQPSQMGIGGFGYGAGSFRASQIKLKNHAVVKEYYEKPSKKEPAGRLIIVAGEKCLHVGPLPFRVGKNNTYDFPLDKLVSIQRPGCFWGDCVVTRGIPIQRRYNSARNRRQEYLNRVAIGVITAEDGTVDLDVLESGIAPGQIITHRPGSAPPRYMEVPSLPFEFDKEIATCLQEFIQLLGVSEIAKQSHAPPGVKSGVALSIALEQDDTRLAGTAERIVEAIRQSAIKWLRLYKQFADGPRVSRWVNKNEVAEVVEWTNHDIRSDDIIVEGASMLVESPAQRRQFVFDLLGTGILNDPDTGKLSREGRAQLLEILEYGNWELGTDDEQLHINKAERENLQLSMGQQVVPVPYDDHILHVNRHNRLRLTVEYEEIIATNPAALMAFEQHMMLHAMFLQRQVGQMTGSSGVPVGPMPPQDGPESKIIPAPATAMGVE